MKTKKVYFEDEEGNINDITEQIKKEKEANYILAKELLDDLVTDDWSLEHYNELKNNYLRGKITLESWDRYIKEHDKKSIHRKSIKEEYLGLIFKREQSQATELLVEEIKKTNHIYTTQNDQKPEIFIYKDGIYVPDGKSEIEKQLREMVGDNFNTWIINQVVTKIRADTYINPKEFFDNNYVYEIAVENGILNIITKELLPFDPKKIFFNKLPVTFDPKCNCPEIDMFLKDILAKEDDYKVFYELTGFCLLNEYKFEKAFMFIGDGRNGKDKSLELIKRLIGTENCCSVPLASLIPDSFIISEFFGKKVNIAGDIGNQDLKDSSTFKALTGRSLVSGQRKFLNAISFVNYAKFIFACNELPMVYDNSRGFWDRWVLLQFPYTFVTEDEYLLQKDTNNFIKLRDENIIEKITTQKEMSGLLNKALEGLHRLLKNRDFSSTLGTQEIKQLWIRKSNSVMAFCLDQIEESYDGSVSKKEFRKRYSDYCKQHQVRTKSDYVIKRTLEEMYGSTESTAQILGKYDRIWEGISWKS